MQTRQLDEFAVTQRRQFESDLNLSADDRLRLGEIILAYCMASMTEWKDTSAPVCVRKKIIAKVKVTA
jgi:hypothetical protein